MIGRIVDVSSSVLTSMGRLGSGSGVGVLGRRPGQLLELYEFEACPFCRKVREALSTLDLSARVYPCPKGGERFRPQVRERGGRELFPYIVDLNTGVEMYESDDIVRYLFDEYGDGNVPLMLSMGPLTDASSVLSGLSRGLGGSRVLKSRDPDQPLELASFEASPFCRIVRETLCALELPYVLRNVAKGSLSREAFEKRSGKMMVPWLADPNTGTELFESEDIVAYLMDEYAIQ
ncbi:MAG: glutathione S-transferase N-terminal domain-containing protein [Myxococcota bacterium]|jgi:glutathione S-transferase|nr:glutathione S-transferase N-terminal domain-containing protein [Myxococcota bacterium]